MRGLSSLLCLLLVAASATAQPGPGDWGDYDDYEGGFENGCFTETGADDGDSVSYESMCVRGNAGGGSVDIFEVIFDVGSEVRFMAEGARVSGSSSGSGSVVTFEYFLNILQIVEFIDDGDGKYVPDDDEVVFIDAFSDSGWSSMRVTTPPQGGVAFEADYDMQHGGTFTIRGKATGGQYSEGGVKVSPMDTKIDFIFEDYGYSGPDSQLALVLHVMSEGTGVKGNGNFGSSSAVVQSRERGVVGSAGSSHVYFTWAKNADVDGTSKPVKDHVEVIHSEGNSQQGGGGSVSVYEAEAGITLAYARGDSIVHDPRLGVQFNVKKDSPGLEPVVVLVGLLALALAARRH